MGIKKHGHAAPALLYESGDGLITRQQQRTLPEYKNTTASWCYLVLICNHHSINSILHFKSTLLSPENEFYLLVH
jgi:hypothetical protein